MTHHPDDDVPDADYLEHIMVTSFILLIAFPLLTQWHTGLAADRSIWESISAMPPMAESCVRALAGSGHPEVYIIALPFFDRLGDLPGVFPRRWLHHAGLCDAPIAALNGRKGAPLRAATGAVLLPFFLFS